MAGNFQGRADGDLAETRRLSRESSRTTHGAAECLDACQVLGALLHHLLNGAAKDDALGMLRDEAVVSPRVQEIIADSYRDKSESEIRASGYVIHTLEAALWAFHRTANFRDAILAAVNLGEDADTTGAVCGQIAGACYRIEGIPSEWREKVAKRQLIEALTSKLSAIDS